MNLAINNDVEKLTISEQKTLLNCLFFTFQEEKQRLVLMHVSKLQITWLPLKINEAKQYLIKNKIYEVEN